VNLLWFEIKFTEVDISRGKNIELINETKKLYKILDKMNGVALYAGKYRKGIGQRYYLSVPDNYVGQNLLQYFKLKKYKQGVKPEPGELNFICGSYQGIKTEINYPSFKTLSINQN